MDQSSGPGVQRCYKSTLIFYEPVLSGSAVIIFSHLARARDTRTATVLWTSLGWATSGVHVLGATIFTTGSDLGLGNGGEWSNGKKFHFYFISKFWFPSYTAMILNDGSDGWLPWKWVALWCHGEFINWECTTWFDQTYHSAVCITSK